MRRAASNTSEPTSVCANGLATRMNATTSALSAVRNRESVASMRNRPLLMILSRRVELDCLGETDLWDLPDLWDRAEDQTPRFEKAFLVSSQVIPRIPQSVFK